jgi:hypothetical protein
MWSSTLMLAPTLLGDDLGAGGPDSRARLAGPLKAGDEVVVRSAGMLKNRTLSQVAGAAPSTQLRGKGSADAGPFCFWALLSTKIEVPWPDETRCMYSKCTN